MRNSNKQYLAYGSNLNLEQMGYRCPYSIPVGPVELPGYKLLFRGGNGNAVATVEPEDGGSVPALLWEITPRCEEALDRYEGWPRLYRKEMITVTLSGKTVEAMVYIMNGSYPLGSPCEQYLNVITKGYTTAGFNTDVLDEAVRLSTPRKSGESKKFMDLTQKIKHAKTCGYFNIRRSSSGNCNVGGYAPFDCYCCKSYRYRGSETGPDVEARNDEDL